MAPPPPPHIKEYHLCGDFVMLFYNETCVKYLMGRVGGNGLHGSCCTDESEHFKYRLSRGRE